MMKEAGPVAFVSVATMHNKIATSQKGTTVPTTDVQHMIICKRSWLKMRKFY
jgi:hypothetical protein